MIIDDISRALKNEAQRWYTRREIARLLKRERAMLYPRDIDKLERLVAQGMIEREQRAFGGLQYFVYRWKGGGDV